VYKQIEQALKDMDAKNAPEQEKIRAILKRYAAEEIGLDEAYYDLLEEELIPMPRGAPCPPGYLKRQMMR